MFRSQLGGDGRPSQGAALRPFSAGTSSASRHSTGSGGARPSSAGFSSRRPTSASRQHSSIMLGGTYASGTLQLAGQREAAASARAEAADLRSGFVASARGWSQADGTMPGATPRDDSEAWHGQVDESNKTALAVTKKNENAKSRTSVTEPATSFSSSSASPAGMKPETTGMLRRGSLVGTEQSTGEKSEGRDSIVIHVHDDRVGQSSDFTCSRAEIVAHMKYFERFLGDSGTEGCDPDDVDISVHCDISIFEWLVKYMRSPTTSTATLAVPSVVSILISSEFLQMGPLVEDCLRYVHAHINQIVKLPIDFGCINATLLRRLAKKFTVDELDEIRDPREKLIGRLYMQKLEMFLEDVEESDVLQQCCHCKRLFNQRAGPAQCIEAKMTIDYHGAVVARHQSNPGWKLSHYILRLRSESKTWREIYWHIWGLSRVMTCTVCGEKFSCTQLGHCSYHPQAVLFETSGGNEGIFPCCGQHMLNFDVSNKSAISLDLRMQYCADCHLRCCLCTHGVCRCGCAARVLRAEPCRVSRRQ